MSLSSIKDFQLKKFLGKGSYGSVYMAVRQSDKKQYAIKKVDTRRMNTKERQEAVNEIRVLASVGGPFNIRFLEAFVDADVLYIVTEFAGHGDLFAWLKARKGKGVLKEATVWSFFLQMCHGLHSLHDKNILHRDLKSANVFMMSDKHIKLGDFGVAKVLKSDDALARTQVGTPYYVAPEVWKNKPYNNKCDVWSLGCLLYELLTFRPPFDSNSMDGLARKVMRGRFDPIPATYSADMKALVAKVLVVEQKLRPSVEQILADPIVQRHMGALPALDGEQPPLGEEVDIMRTILVPRKFNDLKRNLPPSRYETPLNTDRLAPPPGGKPPAHAPPPGAGAPPPSALVHAAESRLAGPPPSKRAGAPDVVMRRPPVAPPSAAGPHVPKPPTSGAPQPGRPQRIGMDGRPAAAAGAPPQQPTAVRRPTQQTAAHEPPTTSAAASAAPTVAHDPAAAGAAAGAHDAAALARRQQLRQQQVAEQQAQGRGLPTVFKHAPSEVPPSHARRPQERLPGVPPTGAGAAAYGGAPAGSQLRVVRHGQHGHGGARPEVAIYHPGQPVAVRSRYAQQRLPEYNPITHQRNYHAAPYGGGGYGGAYAGAGAGGYAQRPVVVSARPQWR